MGEFPIGKTKCTKKTQKNLQIAGKLKKKHPLLGCTGGHGVSAGSNVQAVTASTGNWKQASSSFCQFSPQPCRPLTFCYRSILDHTSLDAAKGGLKSLGPTRQGKQGKRANITTSSTQLCRGLFDSRVCECLCICCVCVCVIVVYKLI